MLRNAAMTLTDRALKHSKMSHSPTKFEHLSEIQYLVNSYEIIFLKSIFKLLIFLCPRVIDVVICFCNIKRHA